MPYRQTVAGEARRNESRIRILLAAQACVAAHGFSGTRMTGIARRAGVATGTLYNHFPSKAELFAEVFRRVARHELALAGNAVAGAGSVDERLKKSLGEWCRRAIESGRLAYALLAEPVDMAVAGERLQFRRAYTRIFAGLIEEGIVSGVFPPQNAEATAAGLIGALSAILVRPLAGTTAAEAGGASVDLRDSEALIDDILAFCMGGVRR